MTPATRERILAPRGLGVALPILGCGAAAVAVLGPLVTDTIRYHVSAAATTQIRGGDVAGLLLVAPCSLLAGTLLRRGHPLGAALAQGPAAYAAYTYLQLAVGGDPSRYPGNSEDFVPLFATLVAVAGYVLGRAWRELHEVEQADAACPRLDRVTGTFLLVVAALLTFGLHLKSLLDVRNGASTEYLDDPRVFWIVKAMDLGIVVPVLAATGIGLLRQRAWARRLRYAVTGWTALLSSSVAGMAIEMQASGDPNGSTANTVTFSTFAATAIALTWRTHLALADSIAHPRERYRQLR